MIEKMSKSMKFLHVPFKGAKSPTKVVEWLDELEGIVEVLKTEEKDKNPL